MYTRASNSELVKPLPEPERTLNWRIRRLNRRVPYDQRNNPPQHPRIVYPSILDINQFRHFLDILRNYDPMDDEPMWAADRVVAPTLGFAITIPETANEFFIKGNSNSDTEKIMARMDAMNIKMDAQYKDQSRAKKTNPTDDETILCPMKKKLNSCKLSFDRLTDKQSGRPYGSLPSNNQPNPRGSNSKAYQPLQSRNEHVNAVFTRSGKSYDPPDNPNDQQNNSENPINFDSDDEDDEPTTQPKTRPTKPGKETPLP
ncbi:hypothetical protein Tco_0343158 [Tanacetum coccineum]